MYFEFTYSDLKYVHSFTRTLVRGDSKKKDLFKLIYLFSGEACISGPGQQIVCSAGDLVMVGQNEEFTLRPMGEGIADYYCLYFSEYLIPPDITNVIRYCGGSYRVTDSPIPPLVSRFDWHLSNVERENLDEIKMLFRCVLTEILIYFSKIAGRQTAMPGMLNGNLEPVLNFISRNLERPLQIQDICAEFHYSRSHLCKIFTQVTGVPLMQYIRSARGAYAVKLLGSGLPAMEVARRLGYSDYSAFYRMYRKYAGCAPAVTVAAAETAASSLPGEVKLP